MPHRLRRWLPAALAPVVVATAVAVPSIASAAGPTLPAMSAQQVLELVAKTQNIDGFSGTVAQHSDLGLPELPSTGAGTDSATASSLNLLTGDHTARVWASSTGATRIAVLDATAERDVIVNDRSVWVWDSKRNTAEHVVAVGTARQATPDGAMMTPSQAAKALLAKVDDSTTVSVDAAQRVAGRDAYTLVLTPKTSATTVASVRIAVDASTGLPLDVQVTARGASSPAFETGFTAISYEVPAASTFVFTPPSDAKVTTKTLTAPSKAHGRLTYSGSYTPLTPTTTGTGWSTIVELPKSAVPSALAADSTVTRLTTATSAGRVLHTALVNVLLTTDGRVLAGAVPVSSLVAAAG